MYDENYMARMIGEASAYLREKKSLNKRLSANWMLGLFLAYVVYLIVNYLYRSDKYMPILLGILMIIVFNAINKQAWKYLHIAKYFRQGIDGEEVTAQELQKLPDEYTAIRDVHIPGMKTNIDFVVLGANGLFTIEVKSHRGEITYDGRQLRRNGYPLEKDFLRQSRTEATALTEYLQANVDRNLYANPILVFSDQKARLKFGRTPLHGVVVIRVDWLREQVVKNRAPIVISPQYIDQIVALLASPEPSAAL